VRGLPRWLASDIDQPLKMLSSLQYSGAGKCFVFGVARGLRFDFDGGITN
jgi:hypothetical protein